MLATILALLAPYQAPKVCQQVASGARVLTVCATPPLELLALLFVPSVLLLLPDFSEITFLGIGLKQRVDEAAAKTQSTAIRVEEAEATIKGARTDARVAQEAVGVANAALVVSALEAVRAREPELPPVKDLDLPSDRAQLVKRLLACWEERLQPYVRLARRRHSAGGKESLARLRDPGATRQPAGSVDPLDTLLSVSLPPTLDDQDMEPIGRWAEKNWYLVNAVEVTCNAAVAGEDLSSEILAEVIRIGEELRRRLPEKVRDYAPNEARGFRERSSRVSPG